MIIEHAAVTVTEGGGAGFEAAIAVAKADVFSNAQGWLGLDLIRCVQAPDDYIVAIRWESVHAHMVTFREGPLFAQWRALVGPFLAKPPSVMHYEAI